MICSVANLSPEPKVYLAKICTELGLRKDTSYHKFSINYRKVQ